MAFYKQKIQKELKKTLENFRNTENRSLKTYLIHKESKKKRIFKPHCNFYQRNMTANKLGNPHVINFYNIINLNELSLRGLDHSESYIQTNFYYKNVRKIEERGNYIILYLNNANTIPQFVQHIIERFKVDQNSKLRQIGAMLQHLAANIEFNAMNQQTDISLTEETYQMLDLLEDTPFVCKIFSEKMVISKSFLQLNDYNVGQFIIETLKYRVPKLKGFSSNNYFDIAKKQIQFYTQLMEVLQGRIPLASFLETARFDFIDKITSRSHIEYVSEMTFSMPIPLVELITVNSVKQIHKQTTFKQSRIFEQEFKRYQKKFKEREHMTLGYLLKLPSNYLLENKSKVVNYVEIQVKREEILDQEILSQKIRTYSSGQDDDKMSPALTQN